jgi:hypothetical protein
MSIMVISLIVWGCYQESPPLTSEYEKRYVFALAILSGFTVSRWIRIGYDDDVRY